MWHPHMHLTHHAMTTSHALSTHLTSFKLPNDVISPEHWHALLIFFILILILIFVLIHWECIALAGQ